jgi:retron-type reverse transcriptase
VTILNQIYEVDLKGFCYGFRPGRSPHQALDALAVGIQWKRVKLGMPQGAVVSPLLANRVLSACNSNPNLASRSRNSRRNRRPLH